MGYAYYRYLNLGLPAWACIAAVVVFCILSAIQMFLGAKESDRASVIFFEAMALFIPFYASNWKVLVVAGVVMFAILFWGYLEGRSELGYSTQIRFFKMTAGVMGKVVTAVILFWILFYAMAQGTAGGNLFVNQGTFSEFFDWASGLANGFYPALTLNGSFQDFTTSIVKQQLTGNAAYQAEDAAQQTKTMQLGTSALIQNFSGDLGVSISPASTTDEVVYSVIVNSLRGWQERFPEGFIVSWAVAVFLVVRSVGVVFIWIVQFLAMAVYEILLSAGFMKIVEQPETQESISW